MNVRESRAYKSDERGRLHERRKREPTRATKEGAYTNDERGAVEAYY